MYAFAITEGNMTIACALKLGDAISRDAGVMATLDRVLDAQ